MKRSLFLICLGFFLGLSASLPVANAQSIDLDEIGGVIEFVKLGIPQGMAAKEICGCHFISGLTFQQCLDHSAVGSLPYKLVSVQLDEDAGTVAANVNIPFVGRNQIATFNRKQPQFGCSLEQPK